MLIVGTGLSMADVVVSLASHGHKGKVTAISRRGIIPKSHDPGTVVPPNIPYSIVSSFSSCNQSRNRLESLDADSADVKHEDNFKPSSDFQAISQGALNMEEILCVEI